MRTKRLFDLQHPAQEVGRRLDDLGVGRCDPCVGAWPEYALRTSVPGIVRILATIILFETGPIDRFAEVGNFASCARCVDSQHISNGKKKGEANTSNGNKYLAWAFVEAANFALRFSVEAKRFYERKRAKTNNAIATKALAHKFRYCAKNRNQGHYLNKLPSTNRTRPHVLPARERMRTNLSAKSSRRARSPITHSSR